MSGAALSLGACRLAFLTADAAGIICASSRAMAIINVDSVHYVYSIFLLAVILGHVGQSCPITPPTPLQRAAKAVQQAEAHMTDNVIILPAFENETTGEAPPANTVRVPLGDTASLSCNAEPVQRIVWRHHNATIQGVDVVIYSTKGHYYRLTSSASTSSLLIHNVTREAAGTVECLLTKGDLLAETTSGDLSVLRQFELEPKLRPQDVFVAPMRNVSTPLWSFSMTCTGRLDCSRAGTAAHFIWKYDGHFVASPYHYLNTIAGNLRPTGLQLGTITAALSLPGAADPVCYTTLTITMDENTNHRPARVDCWIRTDVRRHEWFVQSAYVHFTQSI
ncbi:uncharacterized protein LOC129600866 [Paramacrobiotus metropolitanus]|uniref:uncharacterized protein LOC129600866 n=1 Tax=Paramacrobiotus metropolitanus TaxID=2943436 RepID=UPI0024462E64|nr:uncharacterized protein LOC129600866 [Paramacrobiotus metropolitanus]